MSKNERRSNDSCEFIWYLIPNTNSMSGFKNVEIILYVKNQDRSKQFYENLFRYSPILDVLGMTEFVLSENCKLGLMPNHGIAKIITPKTVHPDLGNGIPRCELYLNVENIDFEFEHAVKIGATLIQEISEMNWGDKVCYFADPDGHIIAFAQKNL